LAVRGAVQLGEEMCDLAKQAKCCRVTRRERLKGGGSAYTSREKVPLSITTIVTWLEDLDTY